MIIHCSQKLAAKLPGISKAPLEEKSPLGSWHGHLMTLDRRQCVMFCHDISRYCLFLPGLRKPHFAELGSSRFRQLYLETLEAMGCPTTQIKKVELIIGPVQFDTATDRSVQGSMRIAKQDLEVWVWRVANVMDLDPIEISLRLNHRPATVHGKSLWPDRMMMETVMGLA